MTLAQTAIAQALTNAGITTANAPTTANEADNLNRHLPAMQQWVFFKDKFVTRKEMKLLVADNEDGGRTHRAINRGAAYFDPQQLVDDMLSIPAAKAALRSSMCWITAARIIGTARTIFFDMHRDAIEAGITMGGIDAYADFTNAIQESFARGTWADDAGLNPDAGNMNGLRKLHALHSNWSSQALQSNTIAGMKFRAPDLDEMTSSPMPIDALSQEKEIAIIRLEAEDEGLSETEIQDQIKLAKEKIVNDYKTNAERTRAIAPAVMAIYTAASSQIPNIEFWQLDRELQVQMIDAIRRSALKCIQSLSKMREVSVSEYVKANRELKALHAELGNALLNYTVH